MSICDIVRFQKKKRFMTPKWQKLASLAQEICTLWFQFFGAVFASKGYPFKNISYAS